MDKREINFTIRLTQEEYEYIKERAEYYGLTMAAYIRFKTICDEYRKGRQLNNDEL